MKVTCSYCQRSAELVTGLVIYPHRPDLEPKNFWRCQPCDAYVGCHGKSDRPLGRLANAELRGWKQRAHAVFDPRWLGQSDRRAARKAAYAWLAGELGIEVEACHIGMFDVAACRRVVEVCRS